MDILRFTQLQVQDNIACMCIHTNLCGTYNIEYSSNKYEGSECTVQKANNKVSMENFIYAGVPVPSRGWEAFAS